MRRCLTLLAILAVGTARAADAPKPNTLTPQEIADGWISLFDGETMFGWKIDGQAQVKDGALILGGEKATVGTATSAFQSFALTFEYQTKRRSEFWPQFWASNPKVHEDVRNRKTFKVYPYYVFLNPEDGWTGARYEVRIEGKTTAHHNGLGHESWSGVMPFAAAIDVPAGDEVRIRNMKVRLLDMEPMLNGKDLSGWKRFTGNEKQAKSEFTVTPEGWINVRNGPGDLQTEKQWGDFVFWGECISNGKALNSGVFFRCIPNQYQQGYECQIHNGFKDNDRTKPADFGTGAIYRRAPARKVVPNDNEWFSMTLIAHGNHFATWVNGYQTVDWIDTRPENENARNGCKLGAGPISLQGHDKTTDLSFRNLRIAELKK